MKNIFFLIIVSLCCACQEKSIEKIPITFVIDFGPDYDNLRVLVFLHNMADSGYVDILATVISNRHELAAPSLQLFQQKRHPDLSSKNESYENRILVNLVRWTLH